MRALPAEWAPLPPSKLAALLALYDQGSDGRVDWYYPPLKAALIGTPYPSKSMSTSLSLSKERAHLSPSLSLTLLRSMT